jgi:hypothetical protein
VGWWSIAMRMRLRIGCGSHSDVGWRTAWCRVHNADESGERDVAPSDSDATNAMEGARHSTRMREVAGYIRVSFPVALSTLHTCVVFNITLCCSRIACVGSVRHRPKRYESKQEGEKLPPYESTRAFDVQPSLPRTRHPTMAATTSTTMSARSSLRARRLRATLSHSDSPSTRP